MGKKKDEKHRPRQAVTHRGFLQLMGASAVASAAARGAGAETPVDVLEPAEMRCKVVRV